MSDPITGKKIGLNHFIREETNFYTYYSILCPVFQTIPVIQIAEACHSLLSLMHSQRLVTCHRFYP